MAIGMNELRTRSSSELYEMLLTTNHSDVNIKRVLLERRFRPHHETRDAVVDEYGADKPDDTELTRLTREAWRANYRGQNLDDPAKCVVYMKTQMKANYEYDEIAKFQPKKNFWDMFRDKFIQWEVSR